MCYGLVSGISDFGLRAPDSVPSLDCNSWLQLYKTDKMTVATLKLHNTFPCAKLFIYVARVLVKFRLILYALTHL